PGRGEVTVDLGLQRRHRRLDLVVGQDGAGVDDRDLGVSHGDLRMSSCRKVDNRTDVLVIGTMAVRRALRRGLLRWPCGQASAMIAQQTMALQTVLHRPKPL